MSGALPDRRVALAHPSEVLASGLVPEGTVDAAGKSPSRPIRPLAFVREAAA